jgi:hypothetical protein
MGAGKSYVLSLGSRVFPPRSLTPSGVIGRPVMGGGGGELIDESTERRDLLLG